MLLALAALWGGLETEVTGETVNVMLEAATFNGPSIRRTSKALGLRSEASGRFERGVDTVLNHNRFKPRRTPVGADGCLRNGLRHCRRLSRKKLNLPLSA